MRRAGVYAWLAGFACFGRAMLLVRLAQEVPVEDRLQGRVSRAGAAPHGRLFSGKVFVPASTGEAWLGSNAAGGEGWRHAATLRLVAQRE